jgi:hypothetical protein
VSCASQSRFSNIFRVSAPDMVPWGKLRVDSDRGGSCTSQEPINTLGLTEDFFSRSISVHTPLCVCVLCHTESIFQHIPCIHPRMVFPSNLGQGYPGGRLYTSGEIYTMEVTVRDLFQYRFMFSYPLVSVSHVTQSRFSNIFRVSAPDMVPWGNLRAG